jgi:hypothetical protein
LPAGSVICQTSQRAAPGGQSAMAWLVTATMIWLAGAVPSTGAGGRGARVGRETHGKAEALTVASCEEMLAWAEAIQGRMAVLDSPRSGRRGRERAL